MNKTIRHLASVATVAVFLIFALGSDDEGSADTSSSVESIEGTKSCLIGYDWVYPSGNSPTGAWKFSSDGTFNSSTTAFGGMSTWGNWSVASPGEVRVSYTRTTEGTIPDDKILTMPNCNQLKVGSTVYAKD